MSATPTDGSAGTSADSPSGGPVIGIDLGTTNSEVAVARDGRVEVLEIEPGTKLLPSYVGMSDDGALLIGQSARNQYALYPERTVRSVKRRMGEAVELELGAKRFSPQAISAMLLRRLKEVAETHLGEPVERAVITVPAFFSDAQRQATREAGELAGLDVARIVNEPTAAALAYRAAERERERILVYDLGGGTFDVSVVNVHEGIVEVLASHGDNHLGGDDFDARIVAHCLAHLRERHGVDASTSPQALSRITRAAEAAKIALSAEPFARIDEEYLLEHDGAPLNLSLELARADYEAMIEGFVDATLEAVHTALEGASLTVADLDEVLLVGGATRTPLIARRLEAVLGLAPRMDVDPELCVAAGAAMQGAMIGGQTGATVLVDVTPYTFGTSALGELDGRPYPYKFIPLIRKNTPIPVARSEVFYTFHDDQTAVEVGVFQGEDEDALNNVEIGKFLIEGLREVPSGNPITSTFTLDLDGILHVSAREKETGLEKSITIAGAVARPGAEEIADVRRRIDALFAPGGTPGAGTPSGSATGSSPDGSATGSMGGAADGAANGTKTVPGGAVSAGTGLASDGRIGTSQRERARTLLERAERLLGDASPEDREDLVDAMETVRDALAADDPSALEPGLATLDDLVFYLDT